MNFASLGANMEPELDACWSCCAVFLSGRRPDGTGLDEAETRRDRRREDLRHTGQQSRAVSQPVPGNGAPRTLTND